MGNNVADFLICLVIGMFICGLCVLIWKFIVMVMIPLILMITIPKTVIIWLIASLIFAVIMYIVTKDVRNQ